MSNSLFVYFPQQREIVASHVRACPVCQLAKAPLGLAEKGSMLVRTRGTRPYATVQVDFIGPVVPGRGGFKHIFTLHDTFSHKLHLRAAVDVSAVSACEAFKDVMDFDVGQPLVVQCDGAGSFKGEFAEMLAARGIKQHVTHAHDPRSNGLA